MIKRDLENLQENIFQTFSLNGKKIPYRFWIAVMIFFTTYVNYTTLVNMSISIMSMTTEMEGKEPECLKNVSSEHSRQKHELPDHGPRMDWGHIIQAEILGSFFWGHILSSIIGGVLAEYCGPFHVILWSSVGCSVFNLLSVFAAYWHYIALMGSRFIVGLFQGMVFPALQTLIARWAPPEEKGRFLGCLTGNSLSTIITWPLLGFVISRYNWPWGFYIISIQLAVYCVVFYIVCSDSPEDNHFISEKERDYIKQKQGFTVSFKKHFPPFRAILTNVPFWMLCVNFFGNLWGLFLQLQSVPKFMAEVVGYELRQTGFIGALPHIMRLLSGIGIGFLGDYLETHVGMSNNAIRKTFTLLSHVIPGGLLIGISFCGCHRVPIVILLTLSMGFNGAISVTCMQNPQDLSPNYAGTIFGLLHLIGGTSGFIAPTIIGITIRHNNGVKEWGYNFILGGIIYIFSGILFILFGSTEEQHWNRIPDEEARR